MMLKQFRNPPSVVVAACLLFACSEDPQPQQPIAGTGAFAGTTAAPPAGAAGIGMMPNPVGAAGQTAGAGMTGFAGQTSVAGTGVAGAGAAGMGAAGMAAAGMAAAGTGGAGGGVAGMGAAGMAAPMFTPGSPTWSAIHQEIIIGTGCNGGPTCHSNTTAGGLKLSNKAEAYMTMVNVKAMGTNIPPMGTNCVDTGLVRVVPGDPAKSLLLKKLEAMPECGARMPIGGMLKPEQIEQVRMWIMLGAKDD